MKNLIVYLILIAFLFQSCYSYRNANLETNSLNTGEHYKINLNGNDVKVKIISVNDSLAKVKIGNAEKEVKISEIKKIKKRVFSPSKTRFLLSPVILIGGLYLLFKDLHLPLGN